jgi:membrane protease YdiL (CAAX protease family)
MDHIVKNRFATLDRWVRSTIAVGNPDAAAGRNRGLLIAPSYQLLALQHCASPNRPQRLVEVVFLALVPLASGEPPYRSQTILPDFGYASPLSQSGLCVRLPVNPKPSSPSEPLNRQDHPLALASPLKFFVLVFGLSVPFWLLGAGSDLQLMPGLSVSALMTFCPTLAALLLVYRERRTVGMIRLLKRSFDFRRIKVKTWLLPIVLVMPGVNAVVYAFMVWSGTPLPGLQVELGVWVLMLVAFFVGALGEELGWSGYILEPLQERWSAFQASMILGVVGVAWHMVPLLLMNRRMDWIAWWVLYTLAARLLTVWLYNNTGRSAFAASLFHATLNLTYMVFPVYGSYFDMRIGSLVVSGVAAVVVLVWGPRSLMRSGDLE